MRTPFNWRSLVNEPDHCNHCGHWLYPCTKESLGHCIQPGCFFQHKTEIDNCDGRGHDLLIEAEKFANAASELSGEWDVDDNADTMHEDPINAAYPFHAISFDDLASEIGEWCDKIRESFMRPKHPIMPVPTAKTPSCFGCFGRETAMPVAHIVEALDCGCWKEWHRGTVVAWFDCRSQVEDTPGHKRCDSARRETTVLYAAKLDVCETRDRRPR